MIFSPCENFIKYFLTLNNTKYVFPYILIQIKDHDSWSGNLWKDGALIEEKGKTNPDKPDPEKPEPEKPDPEKPDPEKPDPEKPDPEKSEVGFECTDA